MISYLNIRQAIDNLFSAKLRSLLAVLGILVGTASVVAMVSSGKMAAEKALQQFKTLGTDLLAISLYDQKADTTTPAFTLEQVTDLPVIIPQIRIAAPYITLYMPLAFEGHIINGSIIGVNSLLKDILKIEVSSGRFISFLDKQSYYCVIGSQIAEQLQDLGITEPLGQQVYLGRYIFTIIGVAKPWLENNFFNQNINQAVLIPIEISNVINRYAIINNIIMRIHEDAAIDRLEQRLTQHIQQIFPEIRLFFRSAKQLIQKMEEQGKTLTLLLGLIGSISLIVGGIGVMNIMLVSVIERRREIGVRMAIGARRKDIQALFLTEAITLSLLGGVLGITVGVLAAAIIAHFAKWQFEIFVTPIIIGFLVSVATGIFFGFYPAYKAAQLDPIEALKTE